MTMVYPIDTSRCALCERRIRTTQHVGLYVVGARAAIGRQALIDQEALIAGIVRPGGAQ